MMPSDETNITMKHKNDDHIQNMLSIVKCMIPVPYTRDARMGYYFIRNRITKLIIRPPSIRTNVSDQFSKPHPPAIR